MPDPNLVWYPNAFRLAVTEGLDKNLAKAGRLLRDEVKTVISKRGAPTGQYSRIKKTSKDGTVTSRRKQRLTPSKPGEPPHMWTGRLRAGITSKRLRFGKVRVSARGGNLMEFGTKNVAARPFLRPTLAKMRSAIEAVLTTPIPTK